MGSTHQVFASGVGCRFLAFHCCLDSTSGFRAYDAKVLSSIDLASLSSHGYAFIVEVLYRSILCGYSCVEVPIIYTERREGQSKMSKSVILESVFAPWKLRFKKKCGVVGVVNILDFP